MSKIGKFVGQILVIVFAAVIIGYTSFLTFILAGRIVPDNLILQAVTVVLFDGAAFVWFTLFLTRANSVYQWGIAAVSWVVSIVLVCIMAGGELAMSQSLFTVENPERLGFLLVIAVIGAAVYNAAMVYIFHLVDGDVLQDINKRVAVAAARAQIVSTALQSIESGQDERIQAEAEALKDSVIQEAAALLSAQAAAHRKAATEARVIDGELKRSFSAETDAVNPTTPKNGRTSNK